MVRAANQTKREFCIAIMNRELHANNICPGNHEVHYSHSWFYFDGSPEQRPDLTAEVDRIMEAGYHYVGYSRVWNTYVLIDEVCEIEEEEYAFAEVCD